MAKINPFFLTVILLFVGTTFSQESTQSAASSSVAHENEKFSGMYSFLRDGEFVQVTVEDQGKVTGFVSRFGDLESDKGAFLDHFFKQGKLDGAKINFTTETVHGVWFQFEGVVDRGEGKNPGDEAYYVLKGTLTQYSTDQAKQASPRSREVVFKSFPQDLAPGSASKD